MNLTGVGRGATPTSDPSAIAKPVASAAAKAAKAGQLKSVKVKMKFDPGKVGKKP